MTDQKKLASTLCNDNKNLMKGVMMIVSVKEKYLKQVICLIAINVNWRSDYNNKINSAA